MAKSKNTRTKNLRDTKESVISFLLLPIEAILENREEVKKKYNSLDAEKLSKLALDCAKLFLGQELEESAESTTILGQIAIKDNESKELVSKLLARISELSEPKSGPICDRGERLEVSSAKAHSSN